MNSSDLPSAPNGIQRVLVDNAFDVELAQNDLLERSSSSQVFVHFWFCSRLGARKRFLTTEWRRPTRGKGPQ
jgi:hypothetical protein